MKEHWLYKHVSVISTNLFLNPRNHLNTELKTNTCISEHTSINSVIQKYKYTQPRKKTHQTAKNKMFFSLNSNILVLHFSRMLPCVVVVVCRALLSLTYLCSQSPVFATWGLRQCWISSYTASVSLEFSQNLLTAPNKPKGHRTAISFTGQKLIYYFSFTYSVKWQKKEEIRARNMVIESLLLSLRLFSAVCCLELFSNHS